LFVREEETIVIKRKKKMNRGEKYKYEREKRRERREERREEREERREKRTGTPHHVCRSA